VACIFGLLTGEEVARGRRGGGPHGGQRAAPPLPEKPSPAPDAPPLDPPCTCWSGPCRCAPATPVCLEQRWRRARKEGGDKEGSAGARFEGASSSSLIPCRTAIRRHALVVLTRAIAATRVASEAPVGREEQGPRYAHTP
jgi:hypothetical protein